MDWKYKHFNQEAVFKDTAQNVLEAARLVVSDSWGALTEMPDGFSAQAFSGLHHTTAEFHVMPAAEGTRLTVEMLVERFSNWGYILWDVGNFYNGQIDRWFTHIALRLGSAGNDKVASISTGNIRIQRGCFWGCVVYLLVGACLSAIAIPLDHALLPAATNAPWGPVGSVALLIALALGILTLLYVAFPDASSSKFIRDHLLRKREKTQK